MSWSESFSGITVEEFEAKVREVRAKLEAADYPSPEIKARQLRQIGVATSACLTIQGSLKGKRFNFWMNGHANASDETAGDSVGAGAGVFEV